MTKSVNDQGNGAEKPCVIVQMATLGIFARQFLTAHLRQLKEAGAEVLLVCSDDAEAKASAETAGVQHVPMRIPQRPAPIADLIALIRLWRLFRKIKPRVVHAHTPKPGLLGLLAGRMAGVPVRIYHNHGLPMLSARGVKYCVLYFIEWMTHRLATQSLFCGRSTRDAAIETGAAIPERSHVLGAGTIAGVDARKYTPNPTGQPRIAQRAAWNIDSNIVVIGFVGRLVAHKGVVLLLEAWRRLDPAVREKSRLLLIGGKAHAEPAIKQAVDDAIAADPCIRNIGWTDDMVSCYSGMDVLVLPSSHEGFPYSILEAQSMELPVIATRATGNVDAVVHESTGLTVPLGDPAALAKALARLICDPDERHRFGQEGRRRVAADFNQRDVVQNMLNFYRSEGINLPLSRELGRKAHE